MYFVIIMTRVSARTVYKTQSISKIYFKKGCLVGCVRCINTQSCLVRIDLLAIERGERAIIGSDVTHPKKQLCPELIWDMSQDEVSYFVLHLHSTFVLLSIST